MRNKAAFKAIKRGALIRWEGNTRLVADVLLTSCAYLQFLLDGDVKWITIHRDEKIKNVNPEN